ncbi:tetraspanin-32 [Sorex araneus]|uniref:tetraspanin-32 n=1 Tax=Sorex araneus TaxID=42254 RepID=UPI0024337D79|nr:tetraspanin-32 [Sorex araneus]
MGTRSRVRVAKCQLLVTSLFVMLLGLSLAALAALTYFGAPFAAAGHGSPERLSFQASPRWGECGGAQWAQRPGCGFGQRWGFSGSTGSPRGRGTARRMWGRGPQSQPSSPPRGSRGLGWPIRKQGPPHPSRPPGPYPGGAAERTRGGRPDRPLPPAFLAGLCLAALLGLGAVLSVVAALREAGGLMAGGFLSFALVFCALVQVAFWRARNPTQVEDALLDAYDALYERAVHSAPSGGHQELAAIQDAFQCCGKSSPFSRLGSAEAHLCQGASGRQVWAGPGVGGAWCGRGLRELARTEGQIPALPLPPPSSRGSPNQPRALEASRSSGSGVRKAEPLALPGGRVFTGGWGATDPHPSPQDCLRSIRDFLRMHGNVASALTGLGLAATVPPPCPVGGPGPGARAYAMLLCSFLWFAIRAGRGLDRKGQYALSPR